MESKSVVHMRTPPTPHAPKPLEGNTQTLAESRPVVRRQSARPPRHRHDAHPAPRKSTAHRSQARTMLTQETRALIALPTPVAAPRHQQPVSLCCKHTLRKIMLGSWRAGKEGCSGERRRRRRRKTRDRSTEAGHGGKYTVGPHISRHMEDTTTLPHESSTRTNTGHMRRTRHPHSTHKAQPPQAWGEAGLVIDAKGEGLSLHLSTARHTARAHEKSSKRRRIMSSWSSARGGPRSGPHSSNY